MLIGAQAFQTTPKAHAPAIVLALTPHIAAWAKTQMDGALCVAGTGAVALGFDKLGNVGVLYPGLQTHGRRLDPDRLDPGGGRRFRHRQEVHRRRRRSPWPAPC